MFHFQSNNPSAYLSYDARRSALEQDALIRRQQERRQAEELALYRHQRRQEAIELAEARREQDEIEQYRREIYQHYRQEELERVEEQAFLRHQQERQSQLAHSRGHCTCHSRTITPVDQPFVSATQPIQVTIHTSASPTPSPQPSPASTPDPASIATSVQSSEEIEAAETLQRHFRAHLERRQKLATLHSLVKTFESRQSAFVLPSTLLFQPASNSSSSSAHDENHKLAFSSTNAPFLAHEDFLVELLSSADAIQSGGDPEVKERRREFVRRVEQELTKLDQAKEVEWHKQNISNSTEAEQEIIGTHPPTESAFATDVVPSPSVTPVDKEMSIPSSATATYTDEAVSSEISSTTSGEPVVVSEIRSATSGASVETLEKTRHEEFVLVE